MQNLDGLIWLLGLLGLLFVLQKLLHHETQAIFYLLSGRSDIAYALFSLLLLPGVLLHEVSHYLMARLLGVQTGRFSLLPSVLGDGQLPLGFVETERTDWMRDSLIGASPLLAGCLFVGYAGSVHLNLPAIWQGFIDNGLAFLLQTFPKLYLQSDFWLWFYLVFAVSSTMFPSSADRRAWLPLGLIILLLFGIIWVSGAVSWLVLQFVTTLNQAFKAIAGVFGISIFIHLIILTPVWLLRMCLNYWRGSVLS